MAQDCNCNSNDITLNQGQPGTQGPQGIAGPQGPQGNPGTNGTNGVSAWDSVCDDKAFALSYIGSITPVKATLDNNIFLVQSMQLNLTAGTYIADFSAWISSQRADSNSGQDTFWKMEITDSSGNVILPLDCTYRRQTLEIIWDTETNCNEIIAISSPAFTVTIPCQIRVFAACSWNGSTPPSAADANVMDRMLRILKLT